MIWRKNFPMPDLQTVSFASVMLHVLAHMVLNE